MIPKGSMITIDYSASVIEEGNKLKVFDTTIRDVAIRESIVNEEKVYQPMLVVLGEGWVPRGLEKIIEKSDIGDKFKVVINSEEAYGPKDPSKIKLVARREFQKININPSIGDRITIGNHIGTVLSVSPTRVRMDYNHLLAGKDIHYNLVIHKIILDDEEKISSLIKRRLPGIENDKLTVRIEDGVINVIMPEQTRYYEYVQFAKVEVSKDIKSLIGNYNGINFIDYFPFN